MLKQQRLVSLLLVLMFGHLLPTQATASIRTTSAPDTTHLAIVMGGAVSLGSFEAGILSELFTQLDLNNRNPHAKEYYLVDCLVGASAGSMSLALLAHEMYNQPFDSAKNVFHQAWVEDIDVDDLLPDVRSDLNNDPFIFSTDIIDDIAKDHLESDITHDRSSFAPDNLYICMTLSNMNGLRYDIEYTNGSKPLIINQDKILFRLKNNGKRVDVVNGRLVPVDSSNWDGISHAAKASGAFPFAFKPRTITRYKDEYTIKPTFEGDSTSFHYADGGYFNNDPINTALKLTEAIDKAREPFRGNYRKEIRRQFIYLAPGDNEKDTIRTTLLDSSLYQYGVRIVSMGMNTARNGDYKQYIEDLETNRQRIQQAMTFALKDFGINPDSALTRLVQTVEILSLYGLRVENVDNFLRSSYLESYSRLIPTQTLQKMADPGQDKSLDDAILYRMGTQSPAPNPQLDMLLQASDLRKKLFLRLFDMLGCKPQRQYILISDYGQFKVQGDEFQSFGGFFSKGIRQFDYNLGRYYAQLSLESEMDLAISGKIDTATVSMWKSSFKKKYEDMPSLKGHFGSDDEKRKNFRDNLDHRIMGYADHFKLPLLAKLPLSMTSNAFLSGQLYHYANPIGFRYLSATNSGKIKQVGFRLYPRDICSSESRYYHKDRPHNWRELIQMDILFTPGIKQWIWNGTDLMIGIDFPFSRKYPAIGKVGVGAGLLLESVGGVLDPSSPTHFVLEVSTTLFELISVDVRYRDSDKQTFFDNISLRMGIVIYPASLYRFHKSLHD